MGNFNYGLLIPILGILMPIFIVGIVTYFRTRDRAELQKTLRLAIEKGQPLPPEYLESLQKTPEVREKTPARDIRTGLILIAVALGIVVLDVLKSDFLSVGGLSGVAAIPGFIGVALLILGLIGNRSRK
ncbi:MAG: DUF6249 domain-containing protein [Asticcacaulis sp.]